MAKLLMKITNPPQDMWPEQLFDNKAHLENWVEEKTQTGKFTNPVLTAKSLTFDGGSAKIETVADDYQN